MTPANGTLRIELKGNLAAMLGAAQNAPCSLTFDRGIFTPRFSGRRTGRFPQLAHP